MLVISSLMACCFTQFPAILKPMSLKLHLVHLVSLVCYYSCLCSAKFNQHKESFKLLQTSQVANPAELLPSDCLHTVATEIAVAVKLCAAHQLYLIWRCNYVEACGYIFTNWLTQLDECNTLWGKPKQAWCKHITSTSQNQQCTWSQSYQSRAGWNQTHMVLYTLHTHPLSRTDGYSCTDGW